MEELLRKRAEILKAIAQPTRLKILELLRDGERCVCEMLPLLDEEQANVSKHLGVLRQAGIVDFRKDGVSSYYFICNNDVLRIIEIVDRMVYKKMQEALEFAKEFGITEKK